MWTYFKTIAIKHQNDDQFIISWSPGEKKYSVPNICAKILLYDKAPERLHDCCHPDKGYGEAACTAGSNVRSAGET